MKKTFYTLVTLLIFASCKTSKENLTVNSEDKSFYDVINKLKKHPANEDAISKLPVVYSQNQLRHLNNINSFESLNDTTRWDKSVNEYKELQTMYEAIANLPVVPNSVKAISYQEEIKNISQQAAEVYYQLGINFLLADSNRKNTLKAYYAFNKSNYWVYGYKDTKTRMAKAFTSCIVNVVINPIADSSFFVKNSSTNGWWSQELIKDLGSPSLNSYPAKFYSKNQSVSENIHPDWVVDLTINDVYVTGPISTISTKTVQSQVPAGSDSLGHAIYRTTYGTVENEKQSYTANGQVQIKITDVKTGNTVFFNTYTEAFNWEQQISSYSGEFVPTAPALSPNSNQPSNEAILNVLSGKLYPHIKKSIITAVAL